MKVSVGDIVYYGLENTDTGGVIECALLVTSVYHENVLKNDDNAGIRVSGKVFCTDKKEIWVEDIPNSGGMKAGYWWWKPKYAQWGNF